MQINQKPLVDQLQGVDYNSKEVQMFNPEINMQVDYSDQE